MWSRVRHPRLTTRGTSDMWLARKVANHGGCAHLSLWRRLCMNEMRQIRLEWDSRQILEIDVGECDYNGDGKLTLNFAYVQHWLHGIFRNKHPYYKSSVFSVCSPRNSYCCDLVKHSETKAVHIGKFWIQGKSVTHDIPYMLRPWVDAKGRHSGFLATNFTLWVSTWVSGWVSEWVES